MRIDPPLHSPAAFTLVELIISSALMTIILATGYICLNAGLASQKLVDTRSEALQSARVALAMMAADLRAAVPLSAELEFAGMQRKIGAADAGNLDFATRNYTPRSQGEFDFCEVSYFLETDPESDALTLWRRRDPTPDPEPLGGGQREEIARGVRGLRFEYYDGFDWYTEWGDPAGKQEGALFPDPNTYGLPEAVRIILSIDPEFDGKPRRDDAEPPPPLVLQTVARVNLAMFFYRTTAGTGDSGGSQAQGGNP